VRIKRDQRKMEAWTRLFDRDSVMGFACASHSSVNSTSSSKQQTAHDNMDDLVSYLLTDPLADDDGSPLDDIKRDANARRLVDYMRKLKAHQVPQEVQGKPLVDVNRCLFLLYTHD
jgi:hypothetical protein